MRTEKELNELILDKINKIRANHPELLKYLSEMPMTIPNEENPVMNLKALESYYDSLLNLLQDYDDNNAENLL